MIDLLLLLGVALCVLSVVMAVVSVLRTQAPRVAAVLLIAGIVVLVASAWLGERSLGLASVPEAWARVISGEAFGTNTVTAPPPAVAEGQAVDAPAVSEPAAQAPLADAPASEGSAQPAQ